MQTHLSEKEAWFITELREIILGGFFKPETLETLLHKIAQKTEEKMMHALFDYMDEIRSTKGKGITPHLLTALDLHNFMEAKGISLSPEAKENEK